MFLDNLSDAGLVLFLGEGNFSFSASVLRRSQEQNMSNVYATCYEKEIDLNVDEASQKMERVVINEKHRKKLHEKTISKTEKSNPIKNENMGFLRSVGCHVLQGVDAEALEQDARLASLSFSRIVFMFPHVGGKMKINRNRQLVQNVLKSARKLLDRNGQVIITLCKGQGGTPFEKVCRVAADTWKIVETAHEAGYVLSQVYHFPHHLFKQYYQVGYRDLQKGFNTEDSVVHVMELSEPEDILPIDNLETKTEHNDVDDGRALPLSLYPPHYVHHLSFWISDELSETLLAQIINTCVGAYVLSWRTIDHYTSSSGRQSQTIEIEYCDTRRALGHTRVLHLHNNVLGLSLVRCAGVEMR